MAAKEMTQCKAAAQASEDDPQSLLQAIKPTPYKKFKNKPRVRREWRTLSDDTLARVKTAFWTLKNTSTRKGQQKYGPYFHNYDDLLMLHACSVKDPRCDQGHTGPHFMTFHRLLLLKLEMALLAVDPTIEALPYWDMAKDSVDGAYRHTDKWIFSSKYFGQFYGTGPNHEVQDGLFALWPIAKYSKREYGAKSALAEEGRCITDQWFQGTTASTCDECCGLDDCTCSDDATYTTYLRDHDDCTPTLVRWPADPDCPNSVKLGGTYELVYTEKDFSDCHQYPENVRSWMQWHNCQDLGFFFCNMPKERLASNPKFMETMADLLPALLDKVREEKSKLERASADGFPVASKLEEAQKLAAAVTASLFGSNVSVADVIPSLCHNPMIYGFYTKQGSPRRSFPHMHHGNAHFKLCKDFEDVTTSPNDPGAFSGHHSNVDRSNMHFLMKSYLADRDLAKSFWHFPATQRDLLGSSGLPPYGLGGPFSAAGLLTCEPDKWTYPLYRFGQAPWTPGTLLDDVANAGYPFVDLFNSSCNGGQDCSGRSHGGYSHREVLYFTSPERTPYTYDTLEHHYY